MAFERWLHTHMGAKGLARASGPIDDTPTELRTFTVEVPALEIVVRTEREAISIANDLNDRLAEVRADDGSIYHGAKGQLWERDP